jgi:phosphocarrier protein
MIARTVIVSNLLGLHARAAARFVHVAGTFQSRITVTRAARSVDGKSILGILLLAAALGTSIELCADGPDEETAIDALCALVDDKFGESE